MASTFKKFCRNQFEYEVRGILLRNNAGILSDITDEWQATEGPTHERIYKVTTKNRAVDIIIFSSVDLSTRHVRRKGRDAVRVVLRWTTRRGPIYKAIAKHPRIETLFRNLEKSILKCNKPFGLDIKQFTPFKEVTA
ncbi:hypothetical protein SP15_304 [Bacillus phage SP-15]|uniref:Uncharacterized protein n=1 Tax=Bacillus phage SP-15 TaxID=1792032 RepID=A0A127AWY2_9CAUD|nr:hypothetical protein SP15_304 [Bacillus phage SP-15]AMM45112.1 hypothetical protein SP15_304 [Bacillus phage SP-15]